MEDQIWEQKMTVEIYKETERKQTWKFFFSKCLVLNKEKSNWFSLG